MVVNDRLCSECKSEMLLDHVSEKDGAKIYYYSCVNPACKERGKAYTATGNESQSTIKERDKSLF